MNYKDSPFREKNKPHWTFPNLSSFLTTVKQFMTPFGVERLLETARAGDTSLVPQAEKFLHDMELEVMQNSPVGFMDVCGYAPCVPAFLSGEPSNMYNRHIDRNADRFRPLNVYFCVSCSSCLTNGRK